MKLKEIVKDKRFIVGLRRAQDDNITIIDKKKTGNGDNETCTYVLLNQRYGTLSNVSFKMNLSQGDSMTCTCPAMKQNKYCKHRAYVTNHLICMKFHVQNAFVAAIESGTDVFQETQLHFYHDENSLIPIIPASNMPLLRKTTQRKKKAVQ